MVYRNNADRLGAAFISVCLQTRWLGQKVVSMSWDDPVYIAKTYIYTYIYVYKYSIYSKNIHIYIYIYMCTYIYPCIRIYTHQHIHIYIYIYTFITTYRVVTPLPSSISQCLSHTKMQIYYPRIRQSPGILSAAVELHV